MSELDRYTVKDMISAYEAFYSETFKKVQNYLDNLPFCDLCDINLFCSTLNNFTKELYGMVHFICLFMSKDDADYYWSIQCVDISFFVNQSICDYVERRKAYYESLLDV